MSDCRRSVMHRSAFLFFFVIASCATILGPQPDPTRFYVLTALQDSNATTAGSGPALGVGPIQIPVYLDRPQMVTRVAPNRVTIAEFDRWAEPLGASVARVLTQNLTTLTDASVVRRFPWAAGETVDYQVQVEIVRFEASESGAADVDTRWNIKNSATKNTVALHDSHCTRAAAAGDTPTVVAALSDCLVDLSREIAGALPKTKAKR